MAKQKSTSTSLLQEKWVTMKASFPRSHSASTERSMDHSDSEKSDIMNQAASTGFFEKERHVVDSCARAVRGPFMFSLCVEVCYCTLMSGWIDNATLRTSPLDELMPFQLIPMKTVICFTLVVSVLGRVIVLFAWRYGVPSFRRHRTCAALFMLFGSVHWVLYFATYYWMYDISTDISRDYKIAVDVVNASKIHTDATNGLAWRECMNSVAGNASMCAGVKAGYCKYQYDSENIYKCAGDIKIGSHRCCIQEKRKLQEPNYKFLGLDVNNVFVLLKWLGILSLSWTLIDSPVASYLGTKTFTQDVWVDVLDAAVFGDYVLSTTVRNLAYGIDIENGSPEPMQEIYMIAVWYTWIVALTTSILSPVMYTLLVPQPADEVKTVSTDDLISKAKEELHDSLAQLDARHAHKYVEQLIELQRQKYAETDHNEPQAVKVLQEDGESAESGAESDWYLQLMRDGRSLYEQAYFRKGLAVQHSDITYMVKYQDNKEPTEELVPLHRIQPDLSQQVKYCGRGCCQGWLQCCPIWSFRGGRRVNYSERMTVYDAFRSLLLLELPFLLWRLWFEWSNLSATSMATLFIAKNAFWVVMDSLTILACGRDSPLMCFFTPLRTIKTMASGTKLSSIWIGPAGVFMLAAQLASKAAVDSAEDKRNRLSAYRAWLQVEKVKAGKKGKAFDKRIREIDEEIRVQDDKIALAHM